MTLQRPKVQQVAGRGDNPAGPIVLALVEAAQAALMARRAALGIVTQPGAGLDQLEAVEKTAASKGRPSLSLGGQALLEARRVELGINYRRPGAGLDQLDQAAASTVEENHGAADQLDGRMVKIYPTLAAALLSKDQAAAGRLWLLLPASDPTGPGHYCLDGVYKAFAGKGSPWHIGGRRRVQQLIKQGADLFWTIDNRGRLWRHGPARVAAALGVDQLAGDPVELPVIHLLPRIENGRRISLHAVKAALYAAALTLHRGQEPRPVTRRTLARLTGACANSQRSYEQIAAVEARRELRFLPGAANLEGLQDAYWKHGRGVFIFTDYYGQQGRGIGEKLLALHMPNSYVVPLAAASRGRQRKINERLNPVITGTRGALNKRASRDNKRGNRPWIDFERIYYDTADGAAAGFNRSGGAHDCLWRQGRTAAGIGLWHTIAARPGGRT